MLNLFFCRTEFEAMVCVQLIASLPASARCVLYAKKRGAYSLASALTSAQVRFLDDEGEFATSLTTTRKIAKLVCEDVGNVSEATVFTADYSAMVCSVIGALLARGAHVQVCLYPHGVGHVHYRPLGARARAMARLKGYARRLIGDPRFINTSDERGYAAPLTKTVYVLAGQAQEVARLHADVRLVPAAPLSCEDSAQLQRALVVGQSTIGDVFLKGDAEARIVAKIKSLADSAGLEGVDYLEHPRRKKNRCLYDPVFQNVQTDLSAEVLAITKGYRMIISFSSSALIYSRTLIRSPDVRVISVGMNTVVEPSSKLDAIRRTFEQVGVEFQDV